MSKFCLRVFSALGALATNHGIRGFLIILALFAVLPVQVEAQFTVLKHRTGATDGSDGFSPLVFANNKLFGTTRSGGQSSFGVVFSMNVDGTGYAVLHNFNGTDGSGAYSGVIVGTDGKLYGVTYSSTAGGGVIYRLNTDGTGFTALRVLANADGTNSWAGLLQAADGKLYGVGSNGGANGRGTAYRIDLDGTAFTVLRNFDTTAPTPYGTLSQGLDGELYGVTLNASGGTGAIYRMNIDGSAFQVLHTLISSEGSNPRAGLMQTSDGKLYGTAISGGAAGGGSLFKLNADGTGFSVLKSFGSASTTEGYAPYQVVPTLGTDGRLYGANYQFPGAAGGTIWSINTDGTGFKVEATLSNTVTGYYPLAGVQKAPDGVLYGQTYNGGTNGGGTIFRLSRPGIGVNFTGGQWSVSAASEPGIRPGANWNNFGGTTSNTGAGIGSNLALVDHGSLPTTARLTYRGAYDAGYGGYSGLSSSNAGTNLLYRGGIYGDDASREASATVTGIPYSYYDVYVYASNEGSTNTLSISNGATTYYSQGTGAATNSVTTLVETTSTNSASPTVGPAQYAVFRGLTSSSFTLTTGGSINGVVAASMLGFQIVPGTAPAVPAPAITSATAASATYNSSFSYQITASNSPTSFGAANLPAGLSVGASGLIMGTITAAAGTSYNIGITATNATGTGSATLALTVNKASAAVVLSNLTQTYDGSTKSATVTTAPAGQPIDVSYTGAVLPPVAAGSYGVLATIQSTSSYTGSASGTLAIQPAAATIALGSLAQFYDGSPKSVSATTTPPGLPVSITYNGSATAPSGVGSFAVVATVTNPNYTGSASGTLTITDNVPPVLTLPTSPVVAEATSPAGASVAFTVSGNDNVDGPVLVTTSAASGSTFSVGNTTVNASAHDAAGNVATGSFTVSVVDTTGPVITVSAPVPPVFSETFASYSGISNGVQYLSGLPVAYGGTVTGWSATGEHAIHAVDLSGTGNYAAMIWHDNVLTLNQSVAANTTGVNYTVKFLAGPAVYQNPNQATGADDGLLIEVLRNDSTVLATYTYKPGAYAGASSIVPASFNYVGDGTSNVRLRVGPSNPYSGRFGGVIDELSVSAVSTAAAPSDLTLEATSAAGAVATFNAIGTDLVDGNVPVTATPPSGSTFALGSTLVQLHAVDAAGNPGNASFHVIVQDTTKPVLSVPANQTVEATSAAGAVAIFHATATDNVGATVTTSIASGSTFPLGSTTVQVTATDAAGNTSTGSFTITVRDTTKPILSLPSDLTVEAVNAAGAVANFTASAIDIVSGNVPVTLTPASGSTFALGTTTVSALATDAAGNTQAGSFKVTVRDTTAPALTLPANQTVEATSAAGAIATFGASATDAVSNVTLSYSVASGSTFALGSTPVTVVAKDAAGNASSGIFTITVRDTTAPVIAAQSNITAEATSANGAVVTFNSTASDIVSGAVSVVGSPASGSMFALGATTVALSAQDAAGNTATGSFIITVKDTTAPVLSVPSNQTLEATSAAGAVATFAASATDAVSAVTLSYSIASGSTFALGANPVTVTATDAAGNASSGSFTVTVRDTTAPVIAPQANLVIEATGANGAVATFTASALDSVSGPVSVSSDIVSGSTFALGTTVVTLTAHDAAGNVATASFSVTVTDTTAPVIAPQDNLFAEATSAAGAKVTFTPSALDIVSGAVGVSAVPASGSVFALGTTTVALSAHDAAGNTVASSFTVTVRDTTAPVIAPQANLVIEATGANGAVATFTPSATDVVSGNVAVQSSIASGSAFPLGTTAVTLTAQDAAGNVSKVVFTVTVQDTTAPIVANQDNLIVEATSSAGAVVTFTPSAIDIVNGAVGVVASPASGSTFALGTTTVTLTAADAAGNKGSKTFTVTVRDTKPPVISSPGNLIAEATSPSGAAVSFNASAADLVDGAVKVSSSIASGSTFAIGTTTVTLTTTDAAGNKATTSFTITVRDTTKPVLTLPANQILEATGPAGAVATYLASATDAVGATLSYTVGSGSVFPLGLNTVTVTATDAAGNSMSGSFTITVRDTTKPVLNLPASFNVEATGAAGAVATFAASANDLVSGAIPVVLSKASGTTFAIGATTVNVSATDAAGNTSTGSFVITVRDTTAPVLTVPANQTIEATSASGATATFAASATDAVGATLTYSKASGSTFAIGTTVVTVTAMDAAGNVTTKTLTITVRDTTAPKITSLTANPASLWPPNHKMVNVTITATVSDVVDPSPITKIILVTSNEAFDSKENEDRLPEWLITGNLTLQLRAERFGSGNGRIYTITVQSTDKAGNVSTKVLTVSVPKNQSGQGENEGADGKK